MSVPARKYTNKVLELLEGETLDAKELSRNLLAWMSEDDVKQFVEANDYLQVPREFEVPEETEEDDEN